MFCGGRENVDVHVLLTTYRVVQIHLVWNCHASSLVAQIVAVQQPFVALQQLRSKVCLGHSIVSVAAEGQVPCNTAGFQLSCAGPICISPKRLMLAC